jgi:hypothetical protein
MPKAKMYRSQCGSPDQGPGAEEVVVEGQEVQALQVAAVEEGQEVREREAPGPK